MHQKLRRSVPSGYDKAGVLACRSTASFARLRRLSLVMSGKTKVGNLKDALVVDQQIGGLHVSVQNVVLVEIFEPSEQLQHITFDLRFGEGDGGVIEQAREVVVHVRRNHVHDWSFALIGCSTC